MTNSKTSVKAGGVVCRIPTPSDAAQVRPLIEECKPLDVNSTYAYLLLCSHFASTCVVAESEGRLAGFLSAYMKPDDPETLFVWQVAVSPRARGQRVGSQMLDAAFEREASRGARFVESTISPGNKASWALFESFAQRRGAAYKSADLFLPEDFGAEAHEEECLLRIGPILPTTH